MDSQQQRPLVASFPKVQLVLLHIVLSQLQQHCDEVRLMTFFIQLREELHSLSEVSLC